MRGTSSANPEGYVDQIMAVSAAVRARVALRFVPISLFADGYPVDLEVIRAAYVELIADMSKVFPRVEAEPADELLDQLDNFARTLVGHLGGSMLAPMAKRARQVAKQSGSGGRDEPRRLLEAALSAALGGLWAGEVPSAEGTGELLALIGIRDGQDLAISAQHLGQTNLSAIDAAVRVVTVEQWQSAREMVALIYRYQQARRHILALSPDLHMPGLEMEMPSDPLSRGCLIPLQLLISDDERAFARQRADNMEAFERLAIHTPAQFRLYLQPEAVDAYASESEEFRTAFERHIREWIAANPADAKLLVEETAREPPGDAN